MPIANHLALPLATFKVARLSFGKVAVAEIRQISTRKQPSRGPVLAVKKEPTLLEDLNQALAAETIAAFRYLYLSKMASGLDSLPLAKMFGEMSDGEWGHVSLFMERIIQLGGIPVSKPAEWEKRTFHTYTEPPRRGNDLKAMIRDSLKLERSAVEFYQKLANKTKDSDLITYKLAVDALADEANEVQSLQALLE